MLVAVTDHAVERFRQRVAGALDARPEIIARVTRAVAAGRISDEPPPGATGARGSVYVRDLVDRSVVFVCRRDGAELIVITLWEQDGGVAAPRVPQRFTNALNATTSAGARSSRAPARKPRRARRSVSSGVPPHVGYEAPQTKVRPPSVARKTADTPT